MNVFEDSRLCDSLKENIKKQRITIPTLIQEKCIPLILDGKDIIGQSATGSGKTLAFGCGVIEHVKAGQGVQALILAPTRELAEQVKKEIVKLTNHLNILAVYGGVAIGPQIDKLQDSEVVIATPGRMLDHLQRGTVDLSNVKLLVLDEADRMLDMGFIDDVEKIVKNCGKKRQTLFFSATLPPKIQGLAKRYMNDPEKIVATKMVDPKKLTQVFYNTDKAIKLSLLVHLLEKEKDGLVMVFCNTRRTTDFVVKNLRANKINATAIHGGLSQNKRSKTLTMFNKAKVEVLVCTDVAARGLHIDNVSHVYNYEIPKDTNDYVHRIGRTARAGEAGKVINIITDRDHDNFRRLLNEHRDYIINELDVPKVERVKTQRMDDDGSSRGGYSNGRGRPQRNGFRGRGPARGSDGPSRGKPRRSNASKPASAGYTKRVPRKRSG